MLFLSKENIMLAYKKASKSRRYKEEYFIFNLNLEENLLKILDDIKKRVYRHETYRLLVINDNKKRYINSPCFRDHILHHMIHNICYSVLDKRIPFNSFATRVGKGQHNAVKYFLNKYTCFPNKEQYYMKMDFSKYFYSIHHDLLKTKIFRYIKNSDLQYCISFVIDSYKSDKIYDDLFFVSQPYMKTEKKGLPIGAIHSQLFANFYLYDLDRYINQILKPKIYIRYMDDLIFYDDLDRLKYFRKCIMEYIDIKLQLNINPRKIIINKMAFGIGILGYIISCKNGKTIFQVNRRNKLKYWKSSDCLKTIDENIYERSDKIRLRSVIESRKSMFVHTGNYKKYLNLL